MNFTAEFPDALEAKNIGATGGGSIGSRRPQFFHVASNPAANLVSRLLRKARLCTPRRVDHMAGEYEHGWNPDGLVEPGRVYIQVVEQNTRLVLGRAQVPVIRACE